MRVYNSSLPLVTPSFILFGLPISGHGQARKRRKEGGRGRQTEGGERELGFARGCVKVLHEISFDAP